MVTVRSHFSLVRRSAEDGFAVLRSHTTPTLSGSEEDALGAGVSSWRGYANERSLIPGAGVLVTGGHDAIRMATGDRFILELPDGNRLPAVIVDRTEERLLLAIGEGPLIRLAATRGAQLFSDFEFSEGLSREEWTVQ
jgi:hypothetical protein